MPPPGARDGARCPLSNPKCISLSSITALELPPIHEQLPPSSFLLSLTAPGSLATFHERQSWKTLGKEHKAVPTPPPQTGPTCFGGGDAQKGPGELLMIQRAFSTDVFWRRGQQVSTWFGFGSPPPFQLISTSTESVPHSCQTCVRHSHHLLQGGLGLGPSFLGGG